jgi:MATE family multidrug resistance protein
MIKLSYRVWALAWPMILSNISVPLLGMVDTAVVGHLGTANDMAAVALGAMVFDILFWAFGFLRMSTTAIAAQEADSNHIFFQSIFIALVTAIVLCLCHPWLNWLIISLVHSDPVVEFKLGHYFDIRIYAAFATLVNYVIYGFYFGRQNTLTPLILLIVTNGLAMLFDVFFVAYWQMGASGIAAANLLAQTLGMILGLILLYYQYLKKCPWPSLAEIFVKKKLIALFQLNRDIFIRTLLLVFTSAFLTRQGASLGVTVVAANAILMHFQMLTSYALDGFAIAAESLVGEAVGKRDRQGFLNALKASAQWTFLIALFFVLIYALFGKTLIMMMTSVKAIYQFALLFLPWVIFLPIVSAPSFLLDGVFIGAAWSSSLRNTMIIASLLVFFPVWFFSQNLGNTGLWLAYVSFMLSRGLGLAWALYLKRFP